MDIKRDIKRLPKVIETAILYKLDNDVIPLIIETIQNDYSSMLNDVVTDRKSKTRPEYYQEEFNDRLEKFEFIEAYNSKITLVVPDIELFDFSGILKVIETILEGTIGVYVEISADDYELVFGKKPINRDPIDSSVPKKELIYLLKHTAFIRKKEAELKKKFVRYPFSNTPSINIFDTVNKLVEDNLDKWIDEVIEYTNKQFVKRHKGV